MSSSDKKDLTRIEDLSEYLHEMSEEESSGNDSLSDELPDLPEGGDDSPFRTSFEDESTSSEDVPFEFPQSDSGAQEETIDFGGGDFEAPADFGSTDFTAASGEFPSEELTADAFSSPEISHDAFQVPREESPLEELEPGPETISFKASIPEEEPYQAPEDFSDVKKFAENSSFAGIGAEGNPSFSVLVRNVRYLEDVNDIMILMKELGLIVDSEEQVRARLMRGTLLVPRISEYSAVFLAHKLRRFDVDIQVGLSDEIHPPKHAEAPETGIVSKHGLYQNQSHHFQFDDPKLDISQIIVAATPALEGYQVMRYLGVASEHKILDQHLVEDEGSQEIPRYYQELAQKLKAHALKAHSNAVVGLNYQLTPLPSEYGVPGAKYRLTCTGNLVWVNKL